MYAPIAAHKKKRASARSAIVSLGLWCPRGGGASDGGGSDGGGMDAMGPRNCSY